MEVPMEVFEGSITMDSKLMQPLEDIGEKWDLDSKLEGSKEDHGLTIKITI
jgi:hypothetical protein